MGCILTFVEQRDGVIRKASLEAISEARRVASGAGWSVCAVLPGHNIKDKAASVGAYGAGTVYVADDERLALFSSEGYAAAVAAAVDLCKPEAIFLPATVGGKDVSGRLAARLGAACLADVTAVTLEAGTFKAVRPVYSSKALATVEAAGPGPVVVTLRPNVFTAEEVGGTATVQELPPLDVKIRAAVKELKAAEGGELDVAEADVIVSGGRGLKAPENFSLVRQLAGPLGAAVGASRAVVDAGWIDHSHQVGQTGKVVTPTLYVACGISGAIQHLAGMSSSKIIVAINKDAEAPIFKVADYGVVGDLFQVLPPMIEEVKKIKAEA